MAKCVLHSFMVPDGPPFYANGPSKAITRCDTHDWQFDGKPAMQCPIGRVEEAAEKAIENIRREVAKPVTDIRELGLTVEFSGTVGEGIIGEMGAAEPGDALR